MLPAQHTPQKHTRYDGAHSRPNKEKKFRHKSHTSYKLFGIPSGYLALGAGLYAPIAVDYVYAIQRRCDIYNACNSAIDKSRRISAAPTAFRNFFFLQSRFKYVYLNPEFFFHRPPSPITSQLTVCELQRSSLVLEARLPHGRQQPLVPITKE